MDDASLPLRGEEVYEVRTTIDLDDTLLEEAFRYAKGRLRGGVDQREAEPRRLRGAWYRAPSESTVTARSRQPRQEREVVSPPSASHDDGTLISLRRKVCLGASCARMTP